MSHNGSTPRIHVAELWGGSGKSSVTLKHDRSMSARRWGRSPWLQGCRKKGSGRTPRGPAAPLAQAPMLGPKQLEGTPGRARQGAGE